MQFHLHWSLLCPLSPDCLLYCHCFKCPCYAKWPVASGHSRGPIISIRHHVAATLVWTCWKWNSKPFQPSSWITPLSRVWNHCLPGGQDRNLRVTLVSPPPLLSHPINHQVLGILSHKDLESVHMLSFRLIPPKPNPLACVNGFL